MKVVDKKAGVKVTVRAKADKKNHNHVGAPMPGLVIETKAKVGQDVKKGQALIVVSAMKMETVVAAPRTGKLVSLPVNVGDNIMGGDLVAEIE